MKPSLLRQLLLYRYRYILGSIAFCVLLVLMVTGYPQMVSPGLTASEITTATRAAELDSQVMLQSSLIDLPYLLLQKTSIKFFGLTNLSIMLPSMVLAIITGFAFCIMISRWFRPNIAFIVGCILAASAPFLMLARSGTAAIMLLFWLSIILLAATNILHRTSHHQLWRLVALIAIPLSLYTPLMIYPLVALTIAGILHPHVRFMAKRIRPTQWAIGIAIFTVLITPLVITIIQQPSRLIELSGLPTSLPAWTDLWFNLKLIIKHFIALDRAVIGDSPQPLFGAAALLLAIFGFVKVIADHHAARSYMLLIWIGLVTPIILLSPQHIMTVLMPIVLIMAVGIESLIREWYKLFPFNPYARLVGFIPLIILLGSIVLSSAAHFYYGNLYGTSATVYYRELPAINHYLKTHKDSPVTLTVPAELEGFYRILSRQYSQLLVTSSDDPTSGRTHIVLAHAASPQSLAAIPKQLVTTHLKDDAILMRVYR